MAAAVQHVVIDTDAGIDDAFALALALRAPHVHVVALTCVSGNVFIDDVVKNVQRLLELEGRPDIPIYKGAAHPLLGEWTPPHFQGHGKDGMGDSNLPTADIPIQSEHASIALSKLFDKYPDAYLITLGPMTNVALAVSLDPSLAKKVKKGHFWMMGGSHLSKGNTTYSAEFNVHVDPEAAEICFQRFSDITMISWEQTLDADLTWRWYDEVIATESNKTTKLLRAITRHYEKLSRSPDHYRQFVMCDMVAMAAMLKPELITEMESLHGTVELGGVHTRGTTVFDWYRASKKEPNVNIVLKIDHQNYGDYTRKIFLNE